jgi:DNA-binding CsgD family transcriptional regulator
MHDSTPPPATTRSGNRDQEIREREADRQAATRDAGDPSLTPRERRTAQKAADKQAAAIRKLLGI